jgi:hypothetical protein
MTTLEEVLAETQKNGRICPQPRRWNQLYEMLPQKRSAGGRSEPALPLILAAWWHAPEHTKIARFREHIEWADTHGCLDKVYAFLRSLPEEEWLHFDHWPEGPEGLT